MRLLVVIAHYFKAAEGATLRSGLDPFLKIGALNEEIAALHRHFGPRRHLIYPKGHSLPKDTEDRRLDIVLLVSQDNHVLDWIGFEKNSFETIRCDCDPLYLGFEAQRIFRERAGQYDYYGFMEDDFIVHDPDFFEKLRWFNREFGPEPILIPTRYETAYSGTPAKISQDDEIPGDVQKRFRRKGQRETLRAQWHGTEQSFRLPHNPHTGCYFVSDDQLVRWMAHPSFYDRDGSWVSPLESAATLAVGKVFDIYKPSAQNPWFFEIEHYGAPYVSRFSTDDVKYGGPLLLDLLRETYRTMGKPDQADDSNSLPSIMSRANLNIHLRDEESRAARDLRRLRSSPRQLSKALLAAAWDRTTRTLRRKLKKYKTAAK